jgi:murein DD-endopeptidase MepM/ murein hydrolase activator NlpD
LAALVLALAASAVVPQSATKAKENQLKQRLESVKANATGVRKELREKKQEVWIAAAEIQRLDERSTAAETRLEATRAQLKTDKAKQAELAEKLREAEESFEKQRILVARRVRAMYMSADTEPLAVLLASRDFSDFAVRRSLLERIFRQDKAAFERLHDLKQEVASQKRAQDDAVARVAALERQRAADQRELDQALAAKKSVLAKLRRERNALEAELNAMEASSDRIMAQLLALRDDGGVRFSGRFVSPARGRVTSGVGYRIHPITGTRRMHNGIDISAPSGTPIVAAAAGTVVTAGWMNGYGNTVVINHGGGVATLYGHCSRLFVSVGQKVQAGQRIAAVGSTGFSTGPHLHFEKRVNGRPVNPRG